MKFINSKIKNNLYIIIPLLGLIFLIIYTKNTAINVAINPDNIRSINRYLDKSFNFLTAWEPTAGHRFLGYVILLYFNKIVFHFNVIFEIAISISSIFVTSIIIGTYYKNNNLGLGMFGITTILLFSLNQWEMLLNNIGCTTYITFALVYLHFILIDSYYIKQQSNKVNIILIKVIPIINILLFAGAYSFIYFSILFLTYILYLVSFCKLNKKIHKDTLYNLLFSLVPLVIYCIGLNSGTNKNIFINIISENPLYIVQFFINSFASVFMGTETITKIFSDKLILLLGFIVILIYCFAIIIYLNRKYYKKTVLPLLLILFSLASHVIVLYARAEFNSIEYGMSSRYYLQFVPGIIGIMIIYALYFKDTTKDKRNVLAWLSVITIIFFVTGNIITTFDELHKSKYRLAYEKNALQIGLNYESSSDEKLKVFQSDPEDVKRALSILEKNNLNLFYDASKSGHKKELNISNVKILSGLYEDKWIERQCELQIKTGEDGKILITGYYPNKITGEETGTIYVDGKITNKFKFIENNLDIEVNAPENKVVNLRIENDFDFEAAPPDVRRLCFIIKDIQCK